MTNSSPPRPTRSGDRQSRIGGLHSSSFSARHGGGRAGSKSGTPIRSSGKAKESQPTCSVFWTNADGSIVPLPMASFEDKSKAFGPGAGASNRGSSRGSTAGAVTTPAGSRPPSHTSHAGSSRPGSRESSASRSDHTGDLHNPKASRMVVSVGADVAAGWDLTNRLSAFVPNLEKRDASRFSKVTRQIIHLNRVGVHAPRVSMFRPTIVDDSKGPKPSPPKARRTTTVTAPTVPTTTVYPDKEMEGTTWTPPPSQPKIEEAAEEEAAAEAEAAEESSESEAISEDEDEDEDGQDTGPGESEATTAQEKWRRASTKGLDRQGLRSDSIKRGSFSWDAPQLQRSNSNFMRKNSGTVYCTAYGKGLETAVTGIMARFFIRVHNAEHLPKHMQLTSEEFGIHVRSGPGAPAFYMTEEEDGQLFAVDWQATLSGRYTLSILCEGQPVRGSPFVVSVEAPVTKARDSHCSGPGLHSSVVGTLASFTLRACDQLGNLRSTGGDKFVMMWKGPSRLGKVSVKDQVDGSYQISYVPFRTGLYQLSITYDNEHIRGSPFSITVLPGPCCGKKTMVEGEGAERAVAGEPSTFDILACDRFGNLCVGGPGGEDFSAQLVDRKLKQHELEVVDSGDGRYTVSFLVSVSGEYRLQVYHLGEPCFSMTKCLTIVAGPPHGPSSETVFDRSYTSTLHAGEERTLHIQARDRFLNHRNLGGDDVKVTVEGPARNEYGVAEAVVTDEGTGRYALRWRADKVGRYYTSVYLNGIMVDKAPFMTAVIPNTCALEKCVAVGTGLASVVAGQPSEFIIQARDHFDNDIALGKQEFGVQVMGPEAFQAAVTDNQNGTYTVRYMARTSGTYHIKVSACNGVEIVGSPFSVFVQPDVTDIHSCSLEGTTSDIVAGVETSFYVVANDRFGNQQLCGGDDFLVSLDMNRRTTMLVAYGAAKARAALRPDEEEEEQEEELEMAPLAEVAGRRLSIGVGGAVPPGEGPYMHPSRLANPTQGPFAPTQPPGPRGDAVSPSRRQSMQMQRKLAVKSSIKDENNGKYLVTFTAFLAGQYTCTVRIPGNKLTSLRFSVKVKAAQVHAPYCELTGPVSGPREMVAGERLDIEVQARDIYKNRITDGGCTVTVTAPRVHSLQRHVRDGGAVPALGIEASSPSPRSRPAPEGALEAVAEEGAACSPQGSPPAPSPPARAQEAAKQESDDDDDDSDDEPEREASRERAESGASAGASRSRGTTAAAKPPPAAAAAPAEPGPDSGDGAAEASSSVGTANEGGRSGMSWKLAGAMAAATDRRTNSLSISVKDRGNGQYHLSCEGTRTGVFQLHIQIDGQSLEKTTCVLVLPAGTHAPSCTIRQPRAANPRAGVPSLVYIEARDRFSNRQLRGGERFAVQLRTQLKRPDVVAGKGGGHMIRARVEDLHSGTYLATYTPSVAEKYKMYVTYCSASQTFETFHRCTVQVDANQPVPQRCLVRGYALHKASVNRLAHAELTVMDEQNNPVPIDLQRIFIKIIGPSGKECLSTLSPDSAAGRCVYKMTLRAWEPGVHSLTVMLDGHHVRGSPFSIPVASEDVKIAVNAEERSGMEAFMQRTIWDPDTGKLWERAHELLLRDSLDLVSDNEPEDEPDSSQDVPPEESSAEPEPSQPPEAGAADGEPFSASEPAAGIMSQHVYGNLRTGLHEHKAKGEELYRRYLYRKQATMLHTGIGRLRGTIPHPDEAEMRRNQALLEDNSRYLVDTPEQRQRQRKQALDIWKPVPPLPLQRLMSREMSREDLRAGTLSDRGSGKWQAGRVASKVDSGLAGSDPSSSLRRNELELRARMDKLQRRSMAVNMQQLERQDEIAAYLAGSFTHR